MMPIWNRLPTTEKLIEGEIQLLEDHRKANKEILTRHFYNMSNMMSRNEGVWLSNGWVKALLWIFADCIYNHRTTKTNQKYPSVNL